MMLTAHIILCSALAWTCWCRLIRTDASTSAAMRYALSLLATACHASIIAPFQWGLQPDALLLILEGSMLTVQIASAPLWRRGVPAGLRRPPKKLA